MIFKTRVGETNLIGKDILTASICSEVALEIYHSSLFKGHHRNVASGVKRMHVGVPVAVLHVVLKTRVGETKILRNANLSFSNCSNVQLEMLSSSVFKTDPRNVTSSVERMLVGVTDTVSHT